MIDLVRTALVGQFEASLAMLNRCVEACTDSQWGDKVANGTARWVAYHTLFFTDLYLSRGEAAFALRDLHAIGGDEREPGACIGLERTPTLDYLAICRSKAVSELTAETPESFAAPSGFSWLPITRFELHVYNIRHIQHHTGQLSAFLRRGGVTDLRWKRSGW